MSIYTLAKYSRIVSRGSDYLIWHHYKGDLCKISKRTKNLIKLVGSDEKAFEKLNTEEEHIIQFLVDKQVLHCIDASVHDNRVDNLYTLNNKHVPWFKDLKLAIIKVTDRCNLSCSYCYEMANIKQGDMKVDLFCKLASEIIKSTKSQYIHFHGGEPTILPLEWYKKALNHLKKAASQHKKELLIGMQSNLVNLSLEKMRLFKKFNLLLSGSLDNPTNPEASMRDKTENVIRNLLTAQSMGFKTGIILNINRSNIHEMHNICLWMERNLKNKKFKANIMYPVGSGENIDVPTATEIFNAQKDILHYMIQTKGETLLETNLCIEIVRFFENYLEGKQRMEKMCHAFNCGANKHILAFAPDGKILPCGRFSSHNEGNILGCFNDYHQMNPQDIQSFYDKKESFHRLYQKTMSACKTCDARWICRYGCKAFIVRTPKLSKIECQPTLYRLEFYKQNIADIKIIYEAYISGS